MGIDITRQPLSIVLTQFFLLMMLFWGRAELYPNPLEGISIASGFALGGIFDAFVSDYHQLGRLLTMSVVFVNAMLITRIVTRNMVITTRTYIPSLIYLAVSSGIFVSYDISGYIASMLIISGSDYLICSFRRVASFDDLFKGGLFFGLAPLFCFETLLLLVAMITAMIIFKRTVRETVVAFAGFMFPLLTYSYVYWGMGYSFSHIAVWGWQSVEWLGNYGVIVGNIEVVHLVFISILILVGFLSIAAFVINARNMRNRAYRIFIYFLWLLLLCAMLFAMPFRSSTGYSLVAIALSVIIPYYFVRYHNYFSTTLYTLLMLSIIAANTLPFF